MNGYYRLLIQEYVSQLVMYLKLTTNSLDSSTFGNNGVDTLMTYSGGYAKFGTGYITVANSGSLSFTNGVTDVSCHIAFGFIWNSKTGAQVWISKRGNSPIEWDISSDATVVRFTLFDGTLASNYIYIDVPTSSISTGVLHTLQFAYNGSMSHTGLTAYLDGTSIGTSAALGTYVRQVNGTQQVIIGRSGSANTNYWKADAKDMAIWKNKIMTPTEITTIDYNIKNNIPLS